MAAIKVIGSVSGGRLDKPASDRLRAAIGRFEGKRLSIALSEAVNPRSAQQNAYWFAVLDEHAVPTFRAYGDNWTSWKIHELVMEELGYQEVLVGKNGKLVVTRRHSSDFSTVEWEEFMERGRAYLATEHGIALPLPNEAV